MTTNLTTKQKLDADPYLAYFIDESNEIKRWSLLGEFSVEVEVWPDGD